MKNTVGVTCQKNYSGYDLHGVNGFGRRAFERMRLFASFSGDKSMLILRAVLALLCLFPCIKARLMEKMQLSSMADLMSFAMQHDLLGQVLI
jgi:hypothetical protein